MRKIILFKYPIFILLAHFIVWDLFVPIKIEALFLPKFLLVFLWSYFIMPCFFALQARLAVMLEVNFLLPFILCFFSLCFIIANSFNTPLEDLHLLFDFGSFKMYILNSLFYLISYLVYKEKIKGAVALKTDL